MGAKLYKQFMDFHETIKIDKDSTTLKEKRDTLESDFKSKFPSEMNAIGIEVKKSDLSFFDQGSYRVGTSTTILDDNIDRDVAVNFPLDVDKYTDSRKIKKCAKNALAILNVREPIIKDPCVTVQYKKKGEDNIHLDFPLYAVWNEQYYLARGKATSENYSWEPCDPKGLNDYFDSCFAGDAGNQLRRVVRYLKKWKSEKYSSSTSSDQKPASIGLTLMAAQGFWLHQKDGQDDDLAALLSVCNAIKTKFIYDHTEGKYTISYNLPKQPWSNVFYKMTVNGQDTFHTKFLELIGNVQNASDATEEYEAAKYLQKSFGKDFELPPKPLGKVGIATKENSYA